MLGIVEHRFQSVRFFRDPGYKSLIRHKPWITTIVDLDTGQVLARSVKDRNPASHIPSRGQSHTEHAIPAIITVGQCTIGLGDNCS